MIKITNIEISELYGIKELKLNGNSVELAGTNATGKTSAIDAIRLALTNKSDKEFIVRDGAVEGEILIQTDGGLDIRRKKRLDKSDFNKVTLDGKPVPRQESYLSTIFTQLQLNPVDFISKTDDEQNRMILDLIEFQWDTNWIKEQFGEIPSGVNYQQNILKVLNDIQAKDGEYYLEREEINRRIRNDKDHIQEINATIPEGYEPLYWKEYSLAETYNKIKEAKLHNSSIIEAKNAVEMLENQLQSLNDKRDNEILEMDKNSEKYKTELETEISDLENQIKMIELKIAGNKEKLSKVASQKELRTNEIKDKYTAIQADTKLKIKTAFAKSQEQLIDVSEWEQEVEKAEEMKGHLNEFNRMADYQVRVKELSSESEELTRKIELARKLPSIILEDCQLPVKELTIVNGRPMVKGRPISNLSEGEKLDLCIDITIANKNNLGIILIDGIERLSEKNAKNVYEKCKEAGLQVIATRTTNANTLSILEL